MTHSDLPITPLAPISSVISVIIVDDHAVVRQGTRDMLNRMPGLEVVGECATATELQNLLMTVEPLLLLLDINLPDQNGLSLLEELKPRFPTLKVILFSAHTEMQYIRKAHELQANGYLSKTVTEAALHQAIQEVMREPQSWVVSPDVAVQFSQAQVQSSAKFTARELEILTFLAQGLTNQGIAKELCLSVKTVDTHVASLIKKADVKNRTQLLAYAYENQLL